MGGRGWQWLVPGLALSGVAGLLCGFSPPPQQLPIEARW